MVLGLCTCEKPYDEVDGEKYRRMPSAGLLSVILLGPGYVEQ
jgi:hypothetical protein